MGDVVTWNSGSISGSTSNRSLIFKRNGANWLEVSNEKLQAYLKTIITEAFINRDKAGYLKPFAEEKGIPTSYSSPMKNPGIDFVFEANGDLLFQGYLVLQSTHLHKFALELAKYAFEDAVFSSEDSFEAWIKNLA